MNNPPVHHPIDLGFSVADGEKIELCYGGQTLRVSFIDWQEEPVSFVCRNALAIRWQEVEYTLSDQERNDSTYEVIDSAWLRQHPLPIDSPRLHLSGGDAHLA